jgi:CheY-like chemotaxis protein
MPPEILSHIFEPFFTTKEVGKGSGLGLAQVFGITQQHGGHLTVRSQPDQGTTFVIYLTPVLPDQEQLPAKNPLADLIVPGQGETILLVEDDPIVRAVMETMLQQLGYQTLTAANGREALGVYAARREDISLVLSDMVMPEVDGPTLFTALKKQNPKIKVVLMSGYHPEKNIDDLLQHGLADWFQKPVSLEALSQIIKKAIAG